MYQIYSIQRPGRPRWALAATALLLLLTVLMAYALVHYKTNPQAFELGNDVVLADARIKVRMPSGWVENLETPHLPEGAVAVFAEQPASDMAGGRKIVIFRGRPGTLGLPSTHLPNSILQWIKVIDLRRGQLHLNDPTFEHIGALPGITQTGLFGNVDPATGQQMIQHIIGRAAMAPGGQTFGLLMFSPRPSLRADLRLADHICDHMRMTDIEIETNPAAAMKHAGIDFATQLQCVYLKENDPDLARVRIMDGRRETAWFLDLYRIPLPASQTPERVVTNMALGLLETTALPHSPQALNQELGREACQLTITIPGNADGLMELWCVRTDPYTGLVLKGRCEKVAEKELKSLCQEMAAQAVVKSYTDLVTDSQKLARQYLQRIAEQKLATWWSDRQGNPLLYFLGWPGLTFAQQAIQISPQQREASIWWEIDDQTVFDLGHRIPNQVRQTWIVREDLSAYALKSQDPRGKYAEFLEPGQNELRSELVPNNGPPVKRSTQVPDTFGCEPVRLLAGGLLANDADAEMAYFTGKEIYHPYLSGWWMTPLGMRQLPVGQQEARAVRVQLDSSPEPVILYYNDTNVLLAVSLDNGLWQQRKDLMNERYIEQTLPPGSH